MKRTWLVGLCALVASTALAEENKKLEWKVIGKDRGIVVTTREEPGREMPTFRGRGNIKAPVLHALSVVLDAKTAPQWAYAVDEVELLKPLDDSTYLIYTRSHAPWPVSDRDMVVKRKLKVVKPGQEYHISLTCQPQGKSKSRRVVRVTDCTSHFNLRKVDENTTFVDYQVNLDPAGRLPDWLVNWASKAIPHETLVNLEKQVKKTKGKYDSEIRTWAAAEPASALPEAQDKKAASTAQAPQQAAKSAK